MPRYNIEPRVSGRDKRLAQLGQLQESDQRQQQADSAQQNAMLSQIAQLYGLQNAQSEQARLGELHPMHMQQLQDAHDAAQWNLGQQQQMGPEQLRATQLVNAGQQGQNEAQALQNANLPTSIEQGNRGREAEIAASEAQRAATQKGVDWYDTHAQGQFDLNNAQRINLGMESGVRANPDQAHLSPEYQHAVYDNASPWKDIAIPKGPNIQDFLHVDAQGNPLAPPGTPENTDAPNPFLLRGLSDIIGGPMDFTNKLTNDLIAEPYDWLSKGVGSKSRMKRLPTHGGSNTVRKSFGLQPTQ